MPDKERLIELLNDYGVGGDYAYNLCDEIEECYMEEIEKAEMWDRVVEIAACSSSGMSGCDTCPIGKVCDPSEAEINCDYPCEFVKYTIDVLTEKEER
jgi:hypothetical protein